MPKRAAGFELVLDGLAAMLEVRASQDHRTSLLEMAHKSNAGGLAVRADLEFDRRHVAIDAVFQDDGERLQSVDGSLAAR